MWQFLPMIAGLLQGNQKAAEQQKQNKISAMLGQAPTNQQAPSQGGGIMGMAGKMMGAMGGDKTTKPDAMGAVDDAMGSFGGGGQQDYSDFLSGPTGGQQHNEPDVDDFLR